MFAESSTRPNFQLFSQLRTEFTGVSVPIAGTPVDAFGALKDFDSIVHHQDVIDPVARGRFDAVYNYINANVASLRASGKNVDTVINYLEYLKDIADRKASVPAAPPTPSSFADKSAQEIQRGFHNLFFERGVPERLPGEPFNEYIQKLASGLIELASSTVWNYKYDNKVSSPYTADYRSRPTYGAIAHIDLLNHQLVHLEDPTIRVKNLGAACDQLGYLFNDPAERAEARALGERVKALLASISVWHNRAAIRRENYNKFGPEGEIKAWEAYTRQDVEPKLQDMFDDTGKTEKEKKFSRAAEFSMAIWAAQSLKRNEFNRLQAYMDPDVVAFCADKYRILPAYRSDDENLKRFIEEILLKIQTKFGLSLKEAELAYHTGESFRVGTGIETQLDVAFKKDAAGKLVGPPTIAAQEGGPKAMSIGLYVESANKNEARPDFNEVFSQTLVHGFAPYSRTAQYTHNVMMPTGRLDISELGDFRSSLAEILAVKGAIYTVDWQSRSTTPDKQVYDAAIQTEKVLWPRAQVSKAATKEQRYFIDINDIPLAKTTLIDREDEINRLRQLFGFGSSGAQFATRVFQNANPFAPNISRYEEIGFDSDSEPISGSNIQYLKTLLKDFRDYWLISSFRSDMDRNPGDFIRLMKFLFNRDDKPDGYVNPKIKAIIEGYKTKFVGKPKHEQAKWVKEVLLEQISGYITYDVLMRSVFFMMGPDFRNIKEADELKDPHGIAHIYNSLGFQNFEEFAVKNRGGSRLVNAAQLAFAINQAVEFRDAFDEESAKLYKAGYRLYGPLGAPDRDSLIFGREHILQMAREFGLGEGYDFIFNNDPKVMGWRLRRIPGHEPTLQYIVDRVILLQFLFQREELHLRGKH